MIWRLQQPKLHTVCTFLSYVVRNSSRLSVSEKLVNFKKTSLRRAKVTNMDMDPTILWPPEAVRGMKILDVSAFKKTVEIPVVKVETDHFGSVVGILKNYYLKLRRFSSYGECPNDSNYKIVYLNPLLYSEKEEEIKMNVNAAYNIVCKTSDIQFTTHSLEMNYDHWDANAVLRAILPLEEAGVSGFSRVGHILHLNLKEHLEPYKKVIGAVLLDKSQDDVTMVVNKVDTIDNSDNTFRSFSMEVLAGEGDTVTTLKQNRCSFTFDFAKVYWNPRLSTEHEVIVRKLSACDILYDVMAGVGPFSIPAALQKKCTVLANDLNPESHRWLVHNVSLNKVQNRITCHNLDGKDFIGTVIKADLISRWKDPEFNGNIHITMNLPSIAVEFLPEFVGLLSDVDISDVNKTTEPIVHVYMFSKDQKVSSCVMRVAFYLGLVDILPDFDGEVTAALIAMHQQGNEKDSGNDKGTENGSQKFGKRSSHKLINDHVEIPGLDIVEVTFVRRVAPVKVMVRVSVRLTKNILLDSEKIPRVLPVENDKTENLEIESNLLNSSPKRQKLESFT